MSQVDISTLKQATSSDESPTPGYLFNDISKATVSSYQFSNQLKDFLLNRIKKDNHNIKYKCLMIIKHVCRVGSVQFKRDISTNIEPIKECLQFKGIPDPLRGDEIYKRVREAAKEVIEIIFDGQTPSMMTSVAASQRIQGFGNTPMVDNTTTTLHTQSSSSSSSNNNNSSNSFSNTLMNTPLSLFGKKQDNLLLSNDNIYNHQQIVNTQNMYAAPQEYSMNSNNFNMSSSYNHLNTTSSSFPSSSNSSNNPSKMQGFGYTPDTNTNNTTSTTTSELMAVTTAVTANVIKNVATSIINLSTGNKASLTSSENSSRSNNYNNSNSSSSGSYNQGPLVNVYGQPIINSGSAVYPPVPSMTAGSTILPTATTNTTTSMYPIPITTVVNTRIVPDIPTHSSDIGRTGQACTDGTYEIQLIQSLCNSGGVKMTLPEDRLQTLLQAVPTLNIDIVGDSLIQLLNDNNWQVRTKALLVIQELLQSNNHNSSHYLYVSYWITNESILTAMLSDPKVSVRTQAQKVIQLLHVHQSTDNSNTQIQYSSSSSTSGNANQLLGRSNMTFTQQVNTLPLIDLMNDITINDNSDNNNNNNNNNIATNNNSLIQFDVHDTTNTQVPTTNTIKSTDNISTPSMSSMSGLFDGLSMSQSTHTNQPQSQNLSTLTTIPAQESSHYLPPTYTTNANTSHNTTISETYPSTSLLASSSSPSSVNPLLTVDIPLSTTTSSMPLPPPPPIPTALPTTQQMSIQSKPNTTMSETIAYNPYIINTYSNDPRLINTATTNNSTTMTATNSSTGPMMMMMNNMTSPTYASPMEVSPLPPLPPATYIATQHTTGTMPLLQAPSRISSLIHTTTTTTDNDSNTNLQQTIPLSTTTTTMYGNTNYGSSSNTNIVMNNTSIPTSNILSNIHVGDRRNTTVRNIGQTMMSTGMSNSGTNSNFTFLKQDTSQATTNTATTITSNTNSMTANNKIDPFQLLENEFKTSLSSTNSTNSNTNSSSTPASSSFAFVTKSKP